MRVLVTGGAGFIGSHLVSRLLDRGHSVRVLDNFSTGRRDKLGSQFADIELVEGDIRSYERSHTAVRDCEVVLHQAALPSVPRSVQDPLTSNAVNVIGTLNILLAARDSGVRRVVYASSSSIYGANKQLPKTEDLSPMPISPYGVAKLAGEGYCRSFWEVYGLETVCLRYFNVFGPGQDPMSQYAAVIPAFITACLARDRPTIFGDGEQSRDFTYVENVVQANLQAIDSRDVSGEVFNIACGDQITVNRLLAAILQIAGCTIEPVYESARPGEVRDSVASIAAARERLGYSPSTSFEEGLRKTMEFFETQPSLARHMVSPA